VRHTEYELSLKWRTDDAESVFQWDKVNLKAAPTDSRRGLGADYFFVSESRTMGYMVNIYINQVGADTVSYHMSKWDRAYNIMISMCIRAPFTSLLPDQPRHIQSVDALQDSIENMYFLYTHGKDTYDEFFVIDNRHTQENGTLAALVCVDHKYALIADHNMIEVVDFMKTSRLNVSDYIPRYTIAKQPH
jgi:hypothetical protein